MIVSRSVFVIHLPTTFWSSFRRLCDVPHSVPTRTPTETCYAPGRLQTPSNRFQEITSHLSELLSSSDGGEDSDSAAPSSSANSEIAFGQTPAYSISKAAVNAVVRALGPRLADECGVRLVAVCPGDVLTRMTSEEEVARGDGVSPEQAALDVVNVALRPADFPPGRFYRAGKEIDW